MARPARYREVVELLHRHTVASFLALLDETFSRGGWLEDCLAIRCPTLVIGGSEDAFPDVVLTTAVAQRIVGSKLHIVFGGQHFPNRTHRAEVQGAIARFLASIGIRS